jgi:hypothetical protein
MWGHPWRARREGVPPPPRAVVAGPLSSSQAEKIAGQGYRVIVPDLYRGKLGVEAEEVWDRDGGLGALALPNGGSPPPVYLARFLRRRTT